MHFGLCLSITGCCRAGSTVPPVPPANTVPPSFTRSGSTLTGNLGTWTGTPTPSLTVEWLRNGTPVAGANTATWAIPDTLLGAVFSLRVTATNAGGSLSLTTAGQFVGVLDPNISALPEAAYSLRRLTANYTGPLIRVRRSSDNAEQDIGYNSVGELDTTALLAFCGAGDGFVPLWYNQTGATNAEQIAASLQPRLVAAGVVETHSGKPSVRGDGVDDIMLCSTAGQLDSGFTVNAVSRLVSNSSFPRIVAKWSNISQNGDWLVSPSTANVSRFGVREAGLNKIAAISGPAMDYSSLHIHTGMVSGVIAQSWYDIVNTATVAVSGTAFPASTNQVCLFKDVHPTTAASILTISEVMWWAQAITTDHKNQIEHNQSQQWLGITP